MCGPWHRCLEDDWFKLGKFLYVISAGCVGCNLCLYREVISPSHCDKVDFLFSGYSTRVSFSKHNRMQPQTATVGTGLTALNEQLSAIICDWVAELCVAMGQPQHTHAGYSWYLLECSHPLYFNDFLLNQPIIFWAVQTAYVNQGTGVFKSSGNHVSTSLL